MIALLLAFALFPPLTACAGRPPVPAEAAAPFVVEEALLGRTTGEGTFSAITGVRRSFTASLEGSWDGETLTLVEDFVYDDGETDEGGDGFVYHLTIPAAGTLEARLDDTPGDGVDVDVHLLDDTASEAGCLARADAVLEVGVARQVHRAI